MARPGTSRKRGICHRKAGHLRPTTEVAAHLIDGDRTTVPVRYQLRHRRRQRLKVVTNRVHECRRRTRVNGTTCPLHFG